MIDDDYQKKVLASKQLHERARYLRGRFLNSVAVIEREIAAILTEYFCTSDADKRQIFFSRVATKFSLNSKKEILIEIVKKDYPRYWDEHKKFLADLHNIQEFRNTFAHSIVDVSDESLSRPLSEGVGFIQWKKGTPITDAEFQKWEQRAKMVSSVIDDIKHLLPYREKA